MKKSILAVAVSVAIAIAIAAPLSAQADIILYSFAVDGSGL